MWYVTITSETPIDKAVGPTISILITGMFKLQGLCKISFVIVCSLFWTCQGCKIALTGTLLLGYLL